MELTEYQVVQARNAIQNTLGILRSQANFIVTKIGFDAIERIVTAEPGDALVAAVLSAVPDAMLDEQVVQVKEHIVSSEPAEVKIEADSDEVSMDEED